MHKALSRKHSKDGSKKSSKRPTTTLSKSKTTATKIKPIRKFATKSTSTKTKSIDIIDSTPTSASPSSLLGLKPLPKSNIKKLNSGEKFYRIAFLRRTLSSASKCYYLNQSDQLSLTDSQFDKLYSQLQEFEGGPETDLGLKSVEKEKEINIVNLLSPQFDLSTFKSNPNSTKIITEINTTREGLQPSPDAKPVKLTARTNPKLINQEKILISIHSLLKSTPWEELGSILPISVVQSVGHIVEPISDAILINSDGGDGENDAQGTKNDKNNGQNDDISSKLSTKSSKSKQTTLKSTKTLKSSTTSTKTNQNGSNSSPSSPSSQTKVGFDNRSMATHTLPMLSIQSVFDLKLFQAFTKTNLKSHSRVQQQVLSLWSDFISLHSILDINGKSGKDNLVGQIKENSPEFFENIFGKNSHLVFNTLQPEHILTLSNILSVSLKQYPDTLEPLLKNINNLIKKSQNIGQDGENDENLNKNSGNNIKQNKKIFSNNHAPHSNPTLLTHSHALNSYRHSNIDSTAPLFVTSEHKYDGIALSIDFDQGKSTVATTRGDGHQGYNVTETFNTFVNTTTKLNIKQFQADMVSLLVQQFLSTIFIIMTKNQNSDQDNQDLYPFLQDPDSVLKSTAGIWNKYIMSTVNNEIYQQLNENNGQNSQNLSENFENLTEKSQKSTKKLSKKSTSSSISPLVPSPSSSHSTLQLTPTPNVFEADFPTIASIPPHFLLSNLPYFSNEMSNLIPLVTKLIISSLKNQNSHIWNGDLNIRGEVILPKASWVPGGHYSSPRHYISGLFNSLEEGGSGPEQNTQNTPKSNENGQNDDQNTSSSHIPQETTSGVMATSKRPVHFLPYSLNFPKAGSNGDQINPLDDLLAQHDKIISLADILTNSQRLTILKNQNFTTTPSVGAHFQGSNTLAPSLPVMSDESIPVIYTKQTENMNQNDQSNGQNDENTITTTAKTGNITTKKNSKKIISGEQQEEEEENISSSSFSSPVEANSISLSQHSTGPTFTMQPISTYISMIESQQGIYPYICDGLVFKTNSILTQSAVGSTAHHPRWAIAPKFQSEFGLTLIKDISLQVGKSGKVVPVAHLLPVMITGTRIQKVVLHNHNQLSNELFGDMRIGDEVKVEKRGGAIPFISGRGTKTYKDIDITALEQTITKKVSGDDSSESGEGIGVDGGEKNDDNNVGKEESTLKMKKVTKKKTTKTSSKTTLITTSTTTTSIIPSINPDLTWLSNIGRHLIDIVPSSKCIESGETIFYCPCINKTTLSKIENSTGTISASLFCISDLCKDKVLATLSFFAGKNGLDIPAMSTATLEGLYDVGLISNKPSTLMRLVVDNRYRSLLYNLGGFQIQGSDNTDGNGSGMVNGNDNLQNKKIKKNDSNLVNSAIEEKKKFVEEKISKLKNLQQNKMITTPWDGLHIQDPSDINIPPSPLPLSERPQGYQRKKIENIINAIAKQLDFDFEKQKNQEENDEDNDDENNQEKIKSNDAKVGQILLAYGLTTTHLNALQDLVNGGVINHIASVQNSKKNQKNSQKNSQNQQHLSDIDTLSRALPLILTNLDIDTITTHTTVRPATARDMLNKLESIKSDIITLSYYDVPCLKHLKNEFY